MRLSGKVAIVTGSARGIGEGVAKRFAKEGANLVLADILIEPLNRVAADIRAFGVRALPIKTDLAKSEEVNQMVQAALKEFGEIDILANIAGGSAREKAGPFSKTSETIWKEVVERNLFTTLNCCRAVINHMIERKTGKIVNVSSGAASGTGTGNLDYAAAKAAIIAATKVLAREVADYGINVNVITPGICDTEGFRAGKMSGQPAYERLSKLEKPGALPVLGKPEDVANLVVFLVSDEARTISGQYYEMGCLGRAIP